MNPNDTLTISVTEIASGEVALRAYRLWEKRGCPFGSPEEDWFRAEQEIRSEQAQPAAATVNLTAQTQSAGT